MKKFLSLVLSLVVILALGCSHNNQSTTPTGTTPTGSTAPAAPVGVTATPGNASVSLSWTASTGATTYNVYFATATGVTTSSTTKSTGIATTTASITGLTNGTGYFFVVTAVNATGESALSSQVTATPIAPVPAAPASLTAAPGNAQAALTWSASAGASSYNVYYGTSATVSSTTGTKIGSISGTSYAVTSLTNGTLYYFIVTAVNASGESPASNVANTTPTNGVTVSLVPGTATSATLQATATTSLTYNFPANAVSAPAVATISPLTQAALPVPLVSTAAIVPHSVQANDTFIAAFALALNPTSINAFNVPIGITGGVGSSVPVNTTLNLAVLQKGVWVDISTFVIGPNGVINQNLASIALPGLLAPGTYLLYQPAVGNNTAVSNLGVALIADDGHRMGDGSNGLQVIHLYDTKGNLLTTPVITYLDYPNAGDLDGQALTPDGSQGIMVDGGNTVRFFSQVQSGVPLASTTTLNTSAYGSDGDSIAILPNGDEAVVSDDASTNILVVSGILSGTPVIASTVPVPGNRDGLVISNDGTVLLARGGSGLTVYAIAPITPTKGNVGGTISHSYTQVLNFTTLGSNNYFEDGRSGMFISPVDSSRAAVVQNGSSTTATIQLVTALNTATPVAGTTLNLPAGLTAYSVSITPDGKLAIVGTSAGLLMFSGVDTGTLAMVGTAAYAPSYTLNSKSVTLGYVPTLGITLDGKYVLAGDQSNTALVVIPYTAAGFATAPAAVLGSVAIPDNDQLLVH